MLIIGCDYHPSFQQIAVMDTETGECEEKRLEHRQAPEDFYPELQERGLEVRIGMEASGHSRWFERLTPVIVAGGRGWGWFAWGKPLLVTVVVGILAIVSGEWLDRKMKS